ncbi:MAG: segregation/condensation protein A [Candidatus Kapabacteria bacterium]|nr:segregation/condensation protein A [Candidatus Kapabacteria bacterium]
MYRIKLDNFEGPFDLLLYFIKRDEINIYDIPIARITDEFLKYIRLMKILDLEIAGEFIVIAASLMQIKIQMLLPRDNENSDNEAEDPRMPLVQKLLEYKQFKEAAKDLSNLEKSQRFTYYRQLYDVDYQTAINLNGVQYKNATVFDLMSAFGKILERKKNQNNSHIIPLITITVEEKIEMIKSLLLRQKKFSFNKIIKKEPKQVIVVTFLALLELIRSGIIIALQSRSFDDIIISHKDYIRIEENA